MSSSQVTSKSPVPTLEYEKQSGAPQLKVAGVDEVGRGCIAGPVIAAAVILPESAYDDQTCPEWLSEVRDSKLLSARQRSKLEGLIQEYALAWAVGEASVSEIDEINILRASQLAMGRAVGLLKNRPDFVWVDGNLLPSEAVLPHPARPLVKGDQKSLTIACASVIAKVHRDRLMDQLEVECPGFGMAQHKGYGTPTHLKVIREKGITVWHRQSFAPVREARDRSGLILAPEQPHESGNLNFAPTISSESNAL
jgi:ribonuclease HII